MCAIFGIIGAYEEADAHDAFRTLVHRGRDASYYLADETSFLGIHRLSITNTAFAFEHLHVHQGIRILFNGEIYNYQLLAQELGLEVCSEMEVLYASYAKWGDDFVKELRGMFAIAVIEEAQIKLFRDPFGKKPLFYTQHNHRFIFASESKAIHRLVPLSFDRKIIPQYLSFGTTLSAQTFDPHICQVGAGECVTFDVASQQSTTVAYHQFLKKPQRISDANEAECALEKVLLDSVAMRLPREVSFACLLSGGLDSSLIAAMASTHQPIDTFSIGYEGYEKYDERPFARRVSEHIGSSHHEVVFDKAAFLQTIDEVMPLLDEPLADPAMLPLYHLMKAVRKEGFKVVLTGDGSDELFMGYRTYKEFHALEHLGALKYKGWGEHYLKAHFSMHKEWEWHKRAFEGSMLFRSSAEVFTDLQQNRLLRMNIKDNASEKRLEPYRNAFEKGGYTSPVDWYSFLDLKVMLGAVFLRKLDRMSMAHSIEARSPFMDKEVVNLAFSCAPELRMTDTSKGLVKSIALRYLPEEIVLRKKKGFNYPYMQWLQESQELEVINRVQEKMQLFEEEELTMYLQKAKQGKFAHHLFSLFMLCKWIEHKIL